MWAYFYQSSRCHFPKTAAPPPLHGTRTWCHPNWLQHRQSPWRKSVPIATTHSPATAGHTLFTLPQPSRHRTCQATAGHTLFTLPSDQQSPNMSSYSWTHALHTLSAQQSPNITRHILSIRVYKTATETPSRSAADFIQSVSKHAAARQALKCCTVHCWTHHELLGKGPDGFLYFLRRQRLLLAISVWWGAVWHIRNLWTKTCFRYGLFNHESFAEVTYC